MGKDFKVTVYGEREEEFKQVFGTNTVPVLLPFPYSAKLEGRPEQESVYMLDVERLTGEQQDRLVTHLARKFASSEVEIRRYLKNEGLPIRAADTVATIENPQQWLLDDAPDTVLLERLDAVMDVLDDTEEVEALSDFDDEPHVESFDDGY